MRVRRVCRLTVVVALLFALLTVGCAGQEEASLEERWLCAIAALPMAELGGDLAVVGGALSEETAELALSVRGIEGSEALRAAIDFRLTEGLRADYLFDCGILAAYRPDELEQAMAALDGALAAHYRAVLAVSDRWGDRGLLATDAAEAALLVGLGFRTGLLSDEEMLDLAAPVAALVQGRFSSFEELLANQTDARLVTDGLTREDAAFLALEEQAAAVLAADDPSAPVLDDGLFGSPLGAASC